MEIDLNEIAEDAAARAEAYKLVRELEHIVSLEVIGTARIDGEIRAIRAPEEAANSECVFWTLYGIDQDQGRRVLFDSADHSRAMRLMSALQAASRGPHKTSKVAA